MKIKPDWTEYIHELRKREVERIFSRCYENCFGSILEIGAGDGYQSGLIKRYTSRLLCTEHNEDRLLKEPDKKIEYMICDAERIDDIFSPGTFDMVFSSNLLEHLEHKVTTLEKISKVMKDDGVCISILPGPFIKLSWMMLFYPNLLVELMEVVTKKRGVEKVYGRIRDALLCQGREEPGGGFVSEMNNNPARRPKTFVERYIFPSTHGEYASHLEELLAYRRSSWISLMEEAGFEVLKVLKMPVCSGYGFGLNALRSVLEKAGLSSTYAYIAFKKEYESPYRKYWEV